MQMCRQLGEMGKRSRDAFQDVLDRIEELYEQVFEQVL